MSQRTFSLYVRPVCFTPTLEDVYSVMPHGIKHVGLQCLFKTQKRQNQNFTLSVLRKEKQDPLDVLGVDGKGRGVFRDSQGYRGSSTPGKRGSERITVS